MDELGRAAKDWAMHIRSQQIIPVYPLTEDLEPGDVFVVDRPIQDQQQAWLEQGYLPLDTHLRNFRPDRADYHHFYAGRYDTKEEQFPADTWRAKEWKEAPMVGFPTYTASVGRESGFDLAFPVQGIPLGLSLLDASEARVTISMPRAFTYALDELHLEDQVRAWASTSEVRHHLADYAPNPANVKETIRFLRVVSRVFAVQQLDVAMQRAETARGSAGVGNQAARDQLRKDLDTLKADLTRLLEVSDAAVAAPASGTSAKRESGLEETSSSLPGDIPLPEPSSEVAAKATDTETIGGPASAERAIASVNRELLESILANLQSTAGWQEQGSSSVSLSKTFDRPLVIGYLGFDIAIGPDGRLGRKVSTFELLNEAISPGSSWIEFAIDDIVQEASGLTVAGMVDGEIEPLLIAVDDEEPNLFIIRPVTVSLANGMQLMSMKIVRVLRIRGIHSQSADFEDVSVAPADADGVVRCFVLSSHRQASDKAVMKLLQITVKAKDWNDVSSLTLRPEIVSNVSPFDFTTDEAMKKSFAEWLPALHAASGNDQDPAADAWKETYADKPQSKLGRKYAVELEGLAAVSANELLVGLRQPARNDGMASILRIVPGKSVLFLGLVDLGLADESRNQPWGISGLAYDAEQDLLYVAANPALKLNDSFGQSRLLVYRRADINPGRIARPLNGQSEKDWDVRRPGFKLEGVAVSGEWVWLSYENDSESAYQRLRSYGPAKK
jgi:hypothetical protein